MHMEVCSRWIVEIRTLEVLTNDQWRHLAFSSRFIAWISANTVTRIELANKQKLA
jgi:hypothetical protein